MNENQFEKRKKQGVRLLLLREELDKGKNINKEEIKEKFDIDDKTFQRDIDFLRAFYTENINPEIEIKYDKKKKGYILKNNKDRFRNEEILAISKILLESRAFCKDELDELLRKLRLLSEEDEMKQVKEMIKNEKFNYVPLKHGKKLLDLIWELSKYITKQEIISISYTTKEGKSKVHRIKPVSIMFSEYYFYIVSFMADKFVEDGPTIFRIDRIKKLKGTGENFEVPYLERFEDGEFRKRVQFMLSGKLRTVKFEYTGILEVVQDRLPTAEVVEEIKLDDGTKKYVITAEVYGKGIDMWLKSQGDKVKVIGEKE
jgi:Predicted transcriptional regulator